MNETKFTVGDMVSMLLDRTERTGVIEQVCGNSLFVRWFMSGTKRLRSWGWISSDWVSRKHVSVVGQMDEFSVKRGRTK
jgi:hypothetical protein